MNKEKLFAFIDELKALCEKHGMYIEEGDYSQPCPSIRLKDGNDDEEIYLTLDKKKDKYIVWGTKFTKEEGRVWFEVKECDGNVY